MKTHIIKVGSKEDKKQIGIVCDLIQTDLKRVEDCIRKYSMSVVCSRGQDSHYLAELQGLFIHRLALLKEYKMFADKIKQPKLEYKRKRKEKNGWHNKNNPADFIDFIN